MDVSSYYHQDINPEILNLAYKLDHDQDFKDKLNRQMIWTSEREIQAKSVAEKKKIRSECHQALWKMSGRNTSLLMPWFYPKYPKRDPFDMRRRPFNMILLFMLVHSVICLRGSRQIGKSTSLATDVRLCAEIFGNFKQLYIAPHSEPLTTFSRKLLEVERAFRYPVTGSKWKQNQYYKNYPNGSEVDLQRVMTSSTPVRGKMADRILLDEAQLFDPGLEMEMLEVLSDSQIKSYVLAGTATTVDSLLETRYQEGCQAVWMINHPDGKTQINCGDPDEVIPYIGPYQMEDPKTKVKIDPLDGQYEFLNPKGFEERYVSIHVPQIINPDKQVPLEWNGIYKAFQRDQRKATLEKLGVPLEEGNREVTEKDLKRICVIPDGLEARLEKCRKGYYRCIVSGFDWGGSDYNTMTKSKVSTTCHAILGLAPDGKVHIIYGTRHNGADYKRILNEIAITHNKFKAQALASDFGGGNLYNTMLREHQLINAGSHVIFDYDDPEAPYCAPPKQSQLANMLMLNKTDSLTALYMAIVSAEPLILAPSWAEFGELMEDFLNNHRVMTEASRAKGGRRFVYHRHGSRPDDFMHATNFAFQLIKLHYNQALINDPAGRELVRSAMSGGGSFQNGWAGILSGYHRNDQDYD